MAEKKDKRPTVYCDYVGKVKNKEKHIYECNLGKTEGSETAYSMCENNCYVHWNSAPLKGHLCIQSKVKVVKK